MPTSPSTQIKKDWAHIRSDIEALKLPLPAYVGIRIDSDRIYITHQSLNHSQNHSLKRQPHLNRQLSSWLSKQAKAHNCKFIAAGINNPAIKNLQSTLWLNNDIVTYYYTSRRQQAKEAQHLASLVEQEFDDNHLALAKLDPNRQVIIDHLVTLKDYQKAVPSFDFAYFKQLANQFKNRQLVFLSATPQGGGVAIMRHALIRFFQLYGVNASWYVLHDKLEAFEITKTKFHNVLQAVASPSTKLTAKDKQIYHHWITANAKLLSPHLADADVIVIDDPQPAGLIPHIKAANPKAKLIYRSHIQIEAHLTNQPRTPQATTWNFIWKFAKHTDCFVAHPVLDFIPKSVPISQTVLMPPTTDPLDGLNKPLTLPQQLYYQTLFNKYLLETNQEPLDFHRPYIIQIARFDPSKGIPDVLESFSKLCTQLTKHRHPLPQLVIAGNGSVDDPDGVPIYNLTLELLNQKYAHLSSHIKIIRLPHNDQLLNAILRSSTITLQLSHKEGFEFKVTEALMKGKPTISYNVGGIPLQIKDSINGFIVDPTGNTDQVAHHLYQLLTNPALYRRMSQQAVRLARPDILTPTNALYWLFLSLELLHNPSFRGNRRHLPDLIAHSRPN